MLEEIVAAEGLPGPVRFLFVGGFDEHRVNSGQHMVDGFGRADIQQLGANSGPIIGEQGAAARLSSRNRVILRELPEMIQQLVRLAPTVDENDRVVPPGPIDQLVEILFAGLASADAAISPAPARPKSRARTSRPSP